LQRVRQDISAAFTIGASDKPAVIVLSDRGATEQRAVLPALLALSAAWKEMVRVGAHDVPLIVESGQVIETHHIALLIAVGASAVFPYLAMELSEKLKPGGAVGYRVAVEAGLRKVLARMGISTVASYRNSHLFETVGLDEDICEEFFEDASSSLGGRNLDDILETSIFFASACVRGGRGSAAGFRTLSFPPRRRAAFHFARARAAHARVSEIAHAGKLCGVFRAGG